MQPRNFLLGALALMAAILAPACNNEGDTVPPEGSQIFVSAIPSPVIIGPCEDPTALLGGAEKCGTTEVIATVTSATGFPLKDQDVRFSNTAGFLFVGSIDNPEPIANKPVPTDGFGNAQVSLITSTSATVEARSGTATASLSLSTTSGDIGSILLQVDAQTCPNDIDTNFKSCTTQELCLIATVVDTSQPPVGLEGILVEFELRDHQTTGNGEFNVRFDPVAERSDGNGIVRTRVEPFSQCSENCLGQGNDCNGTAQLVAVISGGLESNLLEIQINIQ